MNAMKKHFRTAAKVTLILVYLVIIAGASVRMTGSGMGCPDWPKCFGYYIPPTDIEQLLWAPGKEFAKGTVIIREEKLLVAKSDLKTADEFNAENWQVYTKHDYAEFNPTHTWIEYINRLCGALSGLGTLVMAVFSLGFWSTRKSVTLLSWLCVFLMGFQAWLGATVVFSVLNPVKITTHMLVALLIVGLLLYLIRMVSPRVQNRLRVPMFGAMLKFSLLLTVVQVIIGTQVRQFVDVQVKALGYENMHMILNDATLSFYVHRTFSIVVVAVNLYILWLNHKQKLGFEKVNWIFAVLLLEVISGIAMSYAGFPFGTQTIHLVMASILFGLQYYVVLEYRDAASRKNANNNPVTSA